MSTHRRTFFLVLGAAGAIWVADAVFAAVAGGGTFADHALGQRGPVDAARRLAIAATGMLVAFVSLRLVSHRSCDRAVGEAERALRAERDKTQHYTDLAKVLFVALDLEGKVTTINRFGCELLGVSEREVLGRDWIGSFVPPEYRDEARRRFRGVLSGAEASDARSEAPLAAASGQRRMIAWIASVTHDARGRVNGLLASGHDVTEQRQTEEQLRQAQKMEAIGRLAGGIAHDFNNQLTVVQGYCDLLLKQCPDPNTVRNYVGEIRRAAARAATMTTHLLVYSRKHVLREEAVDVNRLLEEMTDMLSRMIGEDVRLRVESDGGANTVWADRIQLEQAIMNVAVNARDAMPDGGQLVVRAEAVELTERFCRENVGASPGPHVMIEFRDNGVGMDAKTLEFLFEPFFTTKPTGQGTGLGLAMVYGFIKQSQGYISVNSQVGQGATFRVYLPAVSAQADRPAAGESAGEPLPTGRGTVLVAEDEPAVREYLVQVLRRCGYEVLAAADADEAVAKLAEREGGPDLLIADVVMPGRNGRELAEHLRSMWPDLKVMFVSGYAGTAGVSGQAGTFSNKALLQKPFGAKDLADAVHRVLRDDPVAAGGGEDAGD